MSQHDLNLLIKDTISDAVGNLLYYHRKEDSELPVGCIDQAVRDGVITIDEMVEEFRYELTKGLKHG
jgi:hypothetical protein